MYVLVPPMPLTSILCTVVTFLFFGLIVQDAADQHSAWLQCKLDSINGSLKSCNKIYRVDMEVGINKYNHFLPMVWQANIYIRFVAECSHYLLLSALG